VKIAPAVAEPLHRARTEVLDEHVGAREQALEERAVAGFVQVEREALLAAVHRLEVGGLAGDERTDAARVVAGRGALDLEDARAEVGEHERAVRTREDAREIEDEDPVERSRRAAAAHAFSRAVAGRRPGGGHSIACAPRSGSDRAA
jgi:hypothetical protein